VIYFVIVNKCLQNECKFRWVRLEKLCKLQQIFLFFFFHFLFSWKMFKGWHLISNFTLHKYLIYWLDQLHVNHKHMSLNLLPQCIIPRSWKPSKYFLHELHIVNSYIEQDMFIHILSIFIHWQYIQFNIENEISIKINKFIYIFYQCCVYEIRTGFNIFILNIKFINI